MGKAKEYKRGKAPFSSLIVRKKIKPSLSDFALLFPLQVVIFRPSIFLSIPFHVFIFSLTILNIIIFPLWGFTYFPVGKVRGIGKKIKLVATLYNPCQWRLQPFYHFAILPKRVFIIITLFCIPSNGQVEVLKSSSQ